MRAHRIILGLAISAACGIAIRTPAFSDEYRGTFEQQLACTPDVNRIVACLRQNTPQLSDGCRAVFESNDSVPDQGTPARGGTQPR